jgi:hypothetical protein
VPPADALTLQPNYAAVVPAGDPWDDRTGRLRYRSNLSLWMAAAEGTVGKGDFKVETEASFGDIFDKLDFGAGLDFEIGKGPWSLIVFAMYQHFEADAATPRGFDADVDSDFAVVDISIAYEFFHAPLGKGPAQLSLEAIGGFRWTFVSSGVEINEGILDGRHQDRETNWFDPYVGGRARIDFDRHWNATFMATVGGFGVGSDVSWSAYGQLEYRFDPKWSLFVGYRALAYEYDDDGFTFDVTLHGPVIGLGMRL